MIKMTNMKIYRITNIVMKKKWQPNKRDQMTGFSFTMSAVLLLYWIHNGQRNFFCWFWIYKGKTNLSFKLGILVFIIKWVFLKQITTTVFLCVCFNLSHVYCLISFFTVEHFFRGWALQTTTKILIAIQAFLIS